MAKEFNFTAVVTVSIYTTVEADNYEEALQIANNRTQIEVYQHGYEDLKNECWVNYEYDGEPMNIKLE